MNMPLDEDNMVSFSTTLFALIRTSLNIKLRGNMNANDTELRKMIKRVWPKTSEKVLNKLIPKQSGKCQREAALICAKLPRGMGGVGLYSCLNPFITLSFPITKLVSCIVFIVFDSVDKILKCDHSNESH